MAYVVHTNAQISQLVSRVILDSRYRSETVRRMRRMKFPPKSAQFCECPFQYLLQPHPCKGFDRLRAVKCDDLVTPHGSSDVTLSRVTLCSVCDTSYPAR